MARKSTAFMFRMPRGCTVGTIHLRETTGKDEQRAVLLAKQKGDKGSFLDEMVKLSIVRVDDEPVEQPFTEIEDWSSKTRAYALKAYLKINGTDEDESEDFLSSAEACEVSANTVSFDEIFGQAGSASRGTLAGG